jgi:uncharacterized protein YjbI with pentapeptide repeats
MQADSVAGRLLAAVGRHNEEQPALVNPTLLGSTHLARIITALARSKAVFADVRPSIDSDDAGEAGSAWTNLSHADLSGMDFGTTDLKAADLTGADLAYSNLAGADLTRAELTRSHLFHANMTRANLTLAILTRANLAYAILITANLTDANLFGAHLFRADLTNANLTGANLTGVNLKRANLAGANMAGARFVPDYLALEHATWSQQTVWPENLPIEELLRRSRELHIGVFQIIDSGQERDADVAAPRTH